LKDITLRRFTATLYTPPQTAVNKTVAIHGGLAVLPNMPLYFAQWTMHKVST